MSKLKVKDLPVVLLNTLSVFGATMAGVVPSSGPSRHRDAWVDMRRSRLREKALRIAASRLPGYVLVKYKTGTSISLLTPEGYVDFYFEHWSERSEPPDDAD